jgi:hypothetical protein
MVWAGTHGAWSVAWQIVVGVTVHVHGHVVVGRARACEVWVVAGRARAAADPRFFGWFGGDRRPMVGVFQILSRTEVGPCYCEHGGGVGWCEG